MKKTLILLVAAMFVIVVGSAFAGVVGGKHDLSGKANATISACQYCHTPHNPNSDFSGIAPLWNRKAPSSTFTMYTLTIHHYDGDAGLSPDIDTVPGAASLTCLSCHDGVTNMGDVLNTKFFDGGSYDDLGAIGAVTANLGTDLSTTHPIGVVMKNGRAYISSPDSGTAEGSNYLIGSDKRIKIYGGDIGTGRVECASCHNPHESNSDYAPFLKAKRATICTDCHNEN